MECCNDGVIRVDFTEVNTAAIIENEYGDMENMTQDQVEEINGSIASLYGEYKTIVIHRYYDGRKYTTVYHYNR